MGYNINGNNRTITLTAGTTQMSVRDTWSRWYDWFLTGDNSKFPIAFSQVGGDAIDATEGTSIPIYLFLQNNWKIRPQESSHTLRVFDGILLVNGGGDPFLSTIGNYNVRINYSQPVQAITISTGGSTGGGLTVDQDRKLDEIHTMQNLNPFVPVEVGDTQIVAGDILINLTETSSTTIAHRQ